MAMKKKKPLKMTLDLRNDSPMNFVTGLAVQHTKEEFETGAVRRKVEPSLMSHIPTAALEALGARYHMGAVERGYGPWNWEQGIPYSNLMQHAFTHLANLGNQLSGACCIDTQDSIVQNAAAVMWGMAAIIHFQRFGNPAEVIGGK